jgi:hypothetical protein
MATSLGWRVIPKLLDEDERFGVFQLLEVSDLVIYFFELFFTDFLCQHSWEK